MCPAVAAAIPLSFQGKKIIVTGAGRGLGRLLVKFLTEREGNVVAISKTKENLASLKANFPSISTLCVDIGNWGETREALSCILGQDKPPVDMLVNNAAINIPDYMMRVTPTDFTRTFNLNVLGPLNLMQIVGQSMISAGKGGSIVNISSVGLKLQVSRQGLYVTSKSALSMMSKVMAAELGPHGIRVNSVCPGLFYSDMSKPALDNPKSRMVAGILGSTPLGRIAEVEEVANVVLFLLHPSSSSYVTGQDIYVCGGSTV